MGRRSRAGSEMVIWSPPATTEKRDFVLMPRIETELTLLMKVAYPLV